MRWLQFGTIDFVRGAGGVEMHVRCLARELGRLGVEVHISAAPEALRESWDVIQTHGSMVPRLGPIVPRSSSAIHLHTLHGLTWERMRACREWFWVGGYAAYFRELRSVAQADGVLSVHGNLSLFRALRAAGKPTGVCGNGWDAANREIVPLRGSEPADSLRPRALFIGRGYDRVKGADRLNEVLRREQRLRDRFDWVAIPGEGFEGSPWVQCAGRLDSDAIARHLLEAAVLVIPSRYEGLPIVAIEALALGTRVVASDVGGIKTLSAELLGLDRVPVDDLNSLAETLLAVPIDSGLDRRTARGEANRAQLFRWSDVARTALDLVERIRCAR